VVAAGIVIAQVVGAAIGCRRSSSGRRGCTRRHRAVVAGRAGVSVGARRRGRLEAVVMAGAVAVAVVLIDALRFGIAAGRSRSMRDSGSHDAFGAGAVVRLSHGPLEGSPQAVAPLEALSWQSPVPSQ